MAKRSIVLPAVPRQEGLPLPVVDPDALTGTGDDQQFAGVTQAHVDNALRDAGITDKDVNYHLVNIGLTNAQWEQYSSLTDEDKGHLEDAFKNAVRLMTTPAATKPELRTGMTVTYVSQTPYGNAYLPAQIMSIHPDHIGLRVFCDKSGGSEWPVNALESDSRKPGTFYR
jgi:hypothetical protein